MAGHISLHSAGSGIGNQQGAIFDPLLAQIVDIAAERLGCPVLQFFVNRGHDYVLIVCLLQTLSEVRRR